MAGAVDAGHQPHLLFPAVRLPLSGRAQVVAGGALADHLTVDPVLAPIAPVSTYGLRRAHSIAARIFAGESTPRLRTPM